MIASGGSGTRSGYDPIRDIMAPFLFRQRVKPVNVKQFILSSYAPSLALENLQTGIDNVRNDVFLSERFAAVARAHIEKLIVRYGGVEGLVAEKVLTRVGVNPPPKSAEGPDFKGVLRDLQLGALRRAKSESNVSIDLLCRLAVLKFLRSELVAQFSAVLEKCRAKLKRYEGPRQAEAPSTVELRERVAQFQLGKRSILRKAGEELLQTLYAVEKEHLANTRRSLFGESDDAGYELLQNVLLLTEDGRDDHIAAEHYVMFGNFERDPDRFHPVLQLAREFMRSAGFASSGTGAESEIDALLMAPENVSEMFGGNNGGPTSEKSKSQQVLLKTWEDTLDDEGVLVQAIAAYETPALLAKYSPPIHPQELKQALIWREERKRVEQALDERGKHSAAEDLHAAIKRVAGCRGVERARVAARFLQDVIRYHRDLQRFQAVMAALDDIHLITSNKLRELSAINNSLYEFPLPDERRPAEAKVVHHVVLKADIRDSSTLTRTLFERGLNPASYFSLNFYEPVNKLLPKYGASKLFIEGDAVILAILEYAGEAQFGVARACGLAREIIEIVRGYNEKSKDAGLPTLELGIGICYQNSAPMYLVDGTQQIMISPALNESDRLSSCSRGARKVFKDVDSLFNVYCFQTIEDADAAGEPDEFLLRYNVGGINLNEAAFQKLRQEISLELHETPLRSVWDEGPVRLYTGMVPVNAGTFHNIVIREGLIPHVEPRHFQVKRWSTRRYYEVCTSDAIYEYAGTQARGAGA